MNMLDTIVPKSDQLNADDLIGRTMTIKVTKVALDTKSEQPVSLHFEGDNGKPYRACKSMRRVLVQIWGPDAKVYEGRSMTLYRDPAVQFGGMAVGGIRISHMSNIDRDVTMALTASRANRRPFVVKPLAAEKAPPRARPAPTQEQEQGDQAPYRDPIMVAFVDATCVTIENCKTAADLFKIIDKIKNNRDVLKEDAPELDQRIGAAVQAANVRLKPTPPPEDDGFPGDAA